MKKFDAGSIDYLCQVEELANFFQVVEVDSSAGKTLGREVVAIANYFTQRKKTRTSPNCKKQGHLKKSAAPRGRRRRTKTKTKKGYCWQRTKAEKMRAPTDSLTAAPAATS
uniref:Uncharacterized protein n=1 Tax=Peronospora matthiolae TaxID=2874970 RepID=A0AAV1U898_9STRA